MMSTPDWNSQNCFWVGLAFQAVVIQSNYLSLALRWEKLLAFQDDEKRTVELVFGGFCDVKSIKSYKILSKHLKPNIP